MNHWGNIMKSHKEIKELLIPFVLGELSEREASEITHHLVECEDCSIEVKQLGKLLECARHTEDLTADEQLCENAKAVILSEVEDAEKTGTEPAMNLQNVRRIVMKRRISKLAAAAVILIAVIVCMNQLDGTGVAWANVVSKVEQAVSVSFRLRTSMTGMPDSVIMVRDSSQYGSRMDVYIDGRISTIVYGSKGENAVVTIVPEAKIYTRMLFTEELREQMHEKEKDPRELVKLFLSVEHRELGRKTLGGVEVEGLEVNSPKVGGGMFESATGRLWVDVKTELPVKMEIEGVSGGGKIRTEMIMDQFMWDEELDASEFEPNIPADYVLLADTKMPEVNEDKMLEGLRFFAELTDGRYPSSLASTTADHEVREAWQQKYDRPPGNEELEKFYSVNAACRFYGELVQGDCDVKYHGDRVTANDIDDELMRWRISEGEYRVIYGDLRVETIVDKEMLLDMALKISGSQVPPEKRGTVLRMLGLNEKDVIRGLGVWLELLDGQYPNSLEPKVAIKQADSLLGEKYANRKQADTEKKKELEQKGMDIFFASAFYDKLIREKKDVAYYGDKITVEDSGKVLMRWKISKKRYRVVFGDLTRKSVTVEKLAELEKLTPE